MPIIEYSEEFGFIGNSTTFNHAISSYAQQYVIGEDKSLVDKFLVEKKDNNPLLDPYQIGFPIQFGRNHEIRG